MSNPHPYSVSTLAARWGCSKRHITNMVKRGELTGFRIGKQMRFTQGEVEAFECGRVMRKDAPREEALEI